MTTQVASAAIAAVTNAIASNPQRLYDRIISRIDTRVRSLELAAAAFGHEVACDVIATCWPELSGAQFASAIFHGDSLRYSAFAYSERQPWTMHVAIVSKSVLFCFCTTGTNTEYVIRIPVSSMFAHTNTDDIPTCFNRRAILALATTLVIFACADVSGDNTVSF